MPFTPRKSPPRGWDRNMSLEERDARTVFVMQIAARTRPRDLEEFFSSVGRIRDVRIITDSKTRRSKGIAYVEFWDIDSVALAIGLNGQRLLGAPLLIQPTQSEKNRAASGLGQVGAPVFAPPAVSGPMKLYVGSLHFNITEDMLRGIFEPFGRIDSIQLLTEPETGRSRGYGFVTFHTADDAKRAMEQLNGFELAGRPIKVGHVTEHQPTPAQKSLDTDELDRGGVDMGTTGRLSLMAKLAEGTGLNLPSQAQNVLNLTQQHQAQQQTPPIATQCFMLSNMFDSSQESSDTWDSEIRDDVIEECSKNGGVLHIFVDKASPQGNVYVKCPSVASAAAAVNSLHGRWFAGKIITANYVPVNNYHSLFPDAMISAIPLQPAYTKPYSETAMM